MVYFSVQIDFCPRRTINVCKAKPNGPVEGMNKVAVFHNHVGEGGVMIPVGLDVALDILSTYLHWS